ncbi:MAG: hypothetical protein Kow0029_24210 [Candidatus Rifleibacteriota bacterium]
MKHFLNFKPTIVFRKGSSFMLKTCLVILYGLPLLLLFFWSYNYFSIRALNEFYADAKNALEKRNDVFSKIVAKEKPDESEIKELEEDYLAYRKVGLAFETSWTQLFQTLESITPGDVMFKRVKIRPDKLVKVTIEGKAEKLESMTGFMKKLFADKNFLNPSLKHHSRENASEEFVNFSLEVDYLGDRGELP